MTEEVKHQLLHYEKNLINLSDTSDFDSEKESTQEGELDEEFK